VTEVAEKTGAFNPEEMARMAIERNGLYSLLATVFRSELTADLLGQMLDTDFLQKLAEVGVDIEALSSMTSTETTLEELSLEFSRLFMGPGRHVPPYESVILGGDNGSLWGPQTSAVKRFIEKSGFSYDEKYHGLPDHISVEHEFMAHLTSLEADAWREGDTNKALNCLQLQREFLDSHLGCWMAAFSDRVEELAELPFYTQMAVLTRNFVEAALLALKKIDYSLY